MISGNSGEHITSDMSAEARIEKTGRGNPYNLLKVKRCYSSLFKVDKEMKNNFVNYDNTETPSPAFYNGHILALVQCVVVPIRGAFVSIYRSVIRSSTHLFKYIRCSRV